MEYFRVPEDFSLKIAQNRTQEEVDIPKKKRFIIYGTQGFADEDIRGRLWKKRENDETIVHNYKRRLLELIGFLLILTLSFRVLNEKSFFISSDPHLTSWRIYR